MSRDGYRDVCHLCLERRGRCAETCPSWVGIGRGEVARALRAGHWVDGVHPDSPILLEVMTTQGAKRQRLDEDLIEALRVQQRVEATHNEVVRAQEDLIQALRVQHQVEMQHIDLVRAQASVEHGRLLAQLHIARELQRREAEGREPEQEPAARGAQRQPESEPPQSHAGDGVVHEP